MVFIDGTTMSSYDYRNVLKLSSLLEGSGTVKSFHILLSIVLLIADASYCCDEFFVATALSLLSESITI